MKKIALSFLVLLVSVGAVFAQADLQVLAVVKYNKGKTDSITVKHLKTRVESYEKQYGRKLTPDERSQVLDSLIDEKLVLQAAAKDGFSVTDSEVDQYFLQSMSQQIGANVSEKELNELIQKSYGISLDELLKTQTGMSVTEYKGQLKNQLLANRYVAMMNKDEIQKVAPTDEEIRSFYEINKTSFVQNDMMQIFLLLVPKGSDPESAKLKCNEYRNKIVSKTLSMEQAELDAQKPGSVYQAGKIIAQKNEAFAINMGITYQNFLNLFNQNEGFISDIMETQVDFRFIQIIKKYSAKMLRLEDIVQPETTVTVYEYIRANLTNQKQAQFLSQAAQEMASKLNTSENVEKKKTGDALLKLLDWGN